jgi:hypothetical protein
MKRSTRKKELKAKAAASREKVKRSDGTKSGFRKIHIDGAVYSWRYYGNRVEIRVPGKLQLKWIVPIWQLQGLESVDAWQKLHEDDDGDRGYAWECTPGMIKQYIEDMRKVTCCGVQEGKTCAETNN